MPGGTVSGGGTVVGGGNVVGGGPGGNSVGGAGGVAGAAPARPRTVRPVVLTALLLLAVTGDFANFYITLSVVANEYPLITVLVVLALTAAAVALAHGAGTLLRERRRAAGTGGAGRAAGTGGAGRAAGTGGSSVLAVLTGSWLFLGLAAAVVRWFAPPTATSVGAAAQFGAAPQFGTPARLGGGGASALASGEINRLTSLLLLALYLASGVLAAWIAYHGHDPEQGAARSAWRRLVWTGFRNRRCQANLARAEAELRRHHARLEWVAADHAATVADREALADELKATTRLEIAKHLGDPMATEALTRTPGPASRSAP
jgi:hypothetical protein